jgi:hypothetical protein
MRDPAAGREIAYLCLVDRGLGREFEAIEIAQRRVQFALGGFVEQTSN